MLGEGLLDQPVFNGDIGDHRLSPDHGRHIGHGSESAIEIEFREVFCETLGSANIRSIFLAFLYVVLAKEVKHTR